jgi:hypothetical protein
LALSRTAEISQQADCVYVKLSSNVNWRTVQKISFLSRIQNFYNALYFPQNPYLSGDGKEFWSMKLDFDSELKSLIAGKQFISRTFLLLT